MRKHLTVPTQRKIFLLNFKLLFRYSKQFTKVKSQKIKIKILLEWARQIVCISQADSYFDPKECKVKPTCE